MAEVQNIALTIVEDNAVEGWVEESKGNTVCVVGARHIEPSINQKGIV
jgi:hypothetical protein